MSAFDDEFGLFSETVVDEPEPLDSARGKVSRANEVSRKEAVPRKESAPRKEPAPRKEAFPRKARPVHRERRPNVNANDPWAGHRRASELLGFLARKLVQKPESVNVELFLDEHAEPVIELVVDPEDLGKVIGRSGRVAQALRTVVRATAEARVAVDILDSEEAAEGFDDEPPASPG